MLFTRVYQLETVTLRYFNVFGPHQDRTSQYSGVLAEFTLQLLANETYDLGEGEQRRDFTFIENVVHATLLPPTRSQRSLGSNSPLAQKSTGARD